MADLKIRLKPFQDKFLFSEKRYPSLVAGVGTGKTMMLLMKIWNYCLQYPNSLALIVRKEFTDLRDSTLKDFNTYFNRNVNTDKEYHFENGSKIMFRHGGEINVLKNINLSIFGIEQAEEFENEEIFTFLRDRLRRTNAPYRQGCLIANTNGHNWIWRLWKNNPPSDDYVLSEATTFDNADVLPKDFIEDCRRRQKEEPKHYAQYIMNSWEEVGADDLLLESESVYKSPALVFQSEGTQRLILSCDVARFGDNETVFTIIKSIDILRWEQIFQEAKKGWDLMHTTGYLLELKRQFRPDILTVDDVGVGGGVTDRLREQRNAPWPFIANTASGNKLYNNIRDEGYFMLKDFFLKDYLKIINDTVLMEQLLSLKFKYKSNGQKTMMSKDEMRKEGLKSPDRADALMMSIYYTKNVFGKSLRNQDSLSRESESEYNVFAQ